MANCTTTYKSQLLVEAVRSVVSQDNLAEVVQVLKDTEVDDATAELASRKGVLVVVEKYLNARKDPNKKLIRLAFGEQISTSLLQNAAENGHLDIVRLVLQRGGENSLQFEDEYKRTCLEKAFIEENQTLVDIILSQGNWKDEMTAAVYRGDHERVEQLLCDCRADFKFLFSKKRILDMMCRRGLLCLLKFSIEKGSHGMDNINILLQVFLSTAASYGQIDLINYLVGQGAQIDQSNALHQASEFNHAECVKYLIEQYGCDVDKKDSDGLTAIMWAVHYNSMEAVKILITRGANVEQKDPTNGLTLLMYAATYGNCEMIQLLLDNGANASIHNYAGYTSLDCAIISHFPDAALCLLPHDQTIDKFSHRHRVTGNIHYVRSFLQIVENSDLNLTKSIEKMLHECVQRSHIDSLKHIFDKYKTQSQSVIEKDSTKIFLEAVQTDKPSLVKLLLQFVARDKFPQELVYKEAEKRNNKEMMKLILDEFQAGLPYKYTDKKPVIPDIVNTDNIFSAIPKSVEWDYSDKLEGIEDKITNNNEILIEDLVDNFHAPTVHLELCHADCVQPIVCQLVREALVIQKDLLKNIGEPFPIFKNADAWPVGSILERTRIGKIPDELDTNVSLDKRLADKFQFYEETQNIVFKDADFSESPFMTRYISGSLRLNSEQQLYDGSGDENKYQSFSILNIERLFKDFLFSLWTQLCQNEYTIPDNCTLSKKHLHINRSFPSCILPDCIDDTHDPPVFKRCIHDKKNSPTLSHSKMGAVLHLVWRNVMKDQEGRLLDFHLDVDFICPMIPTKDKPKITTTKKETYLKKSKPPGWLDELDKTTNTLVFTETLAILGNKSPDTYLCRLKMIGPGTVIASNSKPFMKEESLTGERKKIYIAMKVLKEITGAKITSYRLKASVLQVFRQQPDKMKIGEAVEKVLRHYTNFSGRIGDHFRGICENLQKTRTTFAPKGFLRVESECLRMGVVKFVRE